MANLNRRQLIQSAALLTGAISLPLLAASKEPRFHEFDPNVGYFLGFRVEPPDFNATSLEASEHQAYKRRCDREMGLYTGHPLDTKGEGFYRVEGFHTTSYPSMGIYTIWYIPPGKEMKEWAKGTLSHFAAHRDCTAIKVRNHTYSGRGW